jgi:hypothetical protein
MRPPLFSVELFTTLLEARSYVQEHRCEGVDCPCCFQFAKLYKRKLNSGMARSLIEIYHITRRSNGDGWIDLARMVNPRTILNREWSKLCFWGLLECRDSPPTPGRRHEKYRITADGVEFVLMRRRVRRRVCIYNNVVLGFEGEEIDIVEALGSKFDYRELMSE